LGDLGVDRRMMMMMMMIIIIIIIINATQGNRILKAGLNSCGLG
jgi:hypothetical protein